MDYGVGPNGERICRGAQMGRPNRLPMDRAQPLKLRLVLLPFVDGCYDRWGAYWGSPANVWVYTNRACVDGAYLANGEGQLVEMFVRGNNRADAKQAVRNELPNASFYR